MKMGVIEASVSIEEEEEDETEEIPDENLEEINITEI